MGYGASDMGHGASPMSDIYLGIVASSQLGFLAFDASAKRHRVVNSTALDDPTCFTDIVYWGATTAKQRCASFAGRQKGPPQSDSAERATQPYRGRDASRRSYAWAIRVLGKSSAK
jgi:hypothetical protein